MIEVLKSLIEALRQELQEFGEMLARLERQQACIARGSTDEILVSISGLHEQAAVIQQARVRREQRQHQLADRLHAPRHTLLAHLADRTPAEYRPLLHALIEENNQLLTRVHHRLWQNHLVLRRSMDLLHELVQSFIPNGNGSV